MILFFSGGASIGGGPETLLDEPSDIMLSYFIHVANKGKKPGRRLRNLLNLKRRNNKEKKNGSVKGR